MDHVFVTVKNRRWCMCCDLFQTRKDGGADFPKAGQCKNDTPAAEGNRRQAKKLQEGGSP